MEKLSPLALIILLGLMPLLVLGFMGAVLAGEIGWRPWTLWTAQFGSGEPSGVTSVAAYPGGLFAAGYEYLPDAAQGPTLPRLGPPTEFFLKQYDLSGHEAWTRTFGKQTGWQGPTTVVPTIAVGAEGVYVTAYINGSTQILKYDFNGNEQWTRPFPPSALLIPVYMSAGNGGLYVAGSVQQNNPSQLFVAKYDPGGGEVWIHGFGNSSGQVKAVYAGPSGVYVVGWVGESLPGQTPVGVIDAFMVMYDSSGTQHRIDEFGFAGGLDSATSVSGDGTVVYVTGLTAANNFGFIRKYGLDGSLIETFRFFRLGRGVFSSHVSADASGVYLYTDSDQAPFAIKYDSSGNQVWSFQVDTGLIPGEPIGSPITAGSNGVYVAGGGVDASVREFSKSSSLVLFGLNPPYSFVVVAIPVVASLSALSYGRLRRQATPSRPEGEFADFSRLSQCKNCNGYNIPGASACRHCGARLS